MLQSKSTRVNILFLALLVFQIAVPYLIAPFVKDLSYYSLLLLAQILLQFPIVMYLAITRTNPFKLISFRLFHPGAALLVILMTLCLIPSTMVINLISMLFVENALEDMPQTIAQSQFAVNLLFIAIIPALSEEFAFRGVFFHSLKENGKWFAVILSAFFFGMMHLNFNQFSYTFVIGIVMALAVLATGSIWGSVLVHFTFNGYSVVLLNIQKGLINQTQNLVDQTQSYTLTVADMLAAIVVIGAVAIIMLVPAGCFYYAITHLCHQKDTVGPMFFPKKYRMKEKTEQKEQKQEELKQEEPDRRRILDIFFVLCVVIGFGYMTWLAL